MDEQLTVGSLFTGIAGFEVGFSRAGMRAAWLCETDKNCRRLLEQRFPDIPLYGDVRELPATASVDVLCGGDPCPTRSRARGARPSKHPDLSGYFLSVAARLRPRWVVRENVPAPDAIDFAIGLDLLGYGVVAFALDARDFTAQSRRRQFLVGCPPADSARFTRALLDASNGQGFVASRPEEEAPIAACLTAHPMRLAAEDSYIFEPRRGLRVLDPVECEALQGFPRGWTDGFPRGQRRKMCGNAVNVGCAQWIGERIVSFESNQPKQGEQSMETDDVFSQGLEDGDDPFALADAEFEQARETVTDEPVEGIPVVNAEGEPVPNAPAATAAPVTAGVTETPSSPAAPTATPAASSSAPVADPPPSAPTDGAQIAQPVAPKPSAPAAPASTTVSEPAPNPNLGKTIGEVADEKAEELAEPENLVEQVRQADPTTVPGPTPTGTAETTPTAGVEDPTPAAPTSPATPPAAPTGAASNGELGSGLNPPQPATKKKDSGFRRYLLFTPTGAGKFSEVTWYQNAKGQIVEKGTEGAKKTSSVRARGQEEALRVGYAALGSPPEGAKLVAVAENYWAVKHVAPAEVVPARVKIDIR